MTQGPVRKVFEYYRKFGVRDTGEQVLGLLLRSTFGPILRRQFATPSVAALHFGSRKTTTEVTEALKETSGPIDDTFVGQCRREFVPLMAELQARKSASELTYPAAYGVEAGTGFLIYALTRFHRPAVVLETGVANGESTFLLLAALQANGKGALHSVDISADAGCLLTAAEKRRWGFHAFGGSKAGFRRILAGIPEIDLFIHDSDHSYSWHLFELQSAYEHMSATGVIASDDCDKTYAFLDFCEAVHQKPVLLYDTRKVFGILPRQSGDRSATEI